MDTFSRFFHSNVEFLPVRFGRNPRFFAGFSAETTSPRIPQIQRHRTENAEDASRREDQ